MNFSPVTSSNVAAVAHDPATNTLHVKFKNGGTYAYHGVTADEHHALLHAPSVGAHLHHHIKAKYKGVKVP